jgi:hypothetical protein
MKTELTTKLKKSEYIGIALFIGLFNSASIFHKFGWGDDWAFLNEYKNGISKVNYEHYSGYRPILQKIMDLSFGNLNDYSQLVILRTVSLTGLVLLTLKIISILNRQGFPRKIVIAFGLLLPLLPTFWIYTNWASVFSYTLVCLISIYSFEFFERSKSLSFALLIICFLIYQPAAVFSVFLVFSQFLRNRILSFKNYQYLLMIFFSAISSVILGKLINSILDVSGKQRSSMVGNPNEVIEKIIWVATRPLVLSARPFVIESQGLIPLIASIVGLAATVFLFAILAKGNNKLLFVVNLGLLYSLALLPVLVISENQIDFRILPVTSTMGLLLLISGFSDSISRFKGFKSLELTVFILVLSTVTLYSALNVNKVFIKAFTNNESFIRSHEASESDQGILIIGDDVGWPQNNFIGSLSVKSDFQMSWVPVGEVSEILDVPNSEITYTQKENLGPNTEPLVIDLDKYKESLKDK